MADEGVAPLVLIAGVGAWFYFGDPPRTVAGWFWPDSVAPWESVDGFFYPNRNNLAEHIEQFGLADVSACQTWARNQAIELRDPDMLGSDYECGIGNAEDWNGFKVSRATVK